MIIVYEFGGKFSHFFFKKNHYTNQKETLSEILGELKTALKIPTIHK